MADGVLPFDEEIIAVIHGAALVSGKSIVREGTARQGRLLVHIYEIDLERRPYDTHRKVRLTSGVIAVSSSGNCVRMGVSFYRAPNAVISKSGIAGYVPRECILRVRLLPDYRVLWSATSKCWGSNSPPVIGYGFGGEVGRKRRVGLLEVPRRLCGSGISSSSRRSPNDTTFNPMSEFSAHDLYRLGTTGKIKRRRRHSTDTEATHGSAARLGTQERSPFSETRARRDSDSESMRTVAVGGGAFPKTARGAPPDVVVNRTSQSDGEMFSSDNALQSGHGELSDQLESTASKRYPANPASPQLSKTGGDNGGRCYIGANQSRHVQQNPKWCMWKPYCRDTSNLSRTMNDHQNRDDEGHAPLTPKGQNGQGRNGYGEIWDSGTAQPPPGIPSFIDVDLPGSTHDVPMKTTHMQQTQPRNECEVLTIDAGANAMYTCWAVPILF